MSPKINCPHCMSVIHEEAAICPHCQRRADDRPRWYNIGCATLIGLFLLATGIGLFRFTSSLSLEFHAAILAVGAIWTLYLLSKRWLPFMG